MAINGIAIKINEIAIKIDEIAVEINEIAIRYLGIAWLSHLDLGSWLRYLN